MAPYSLSLQYCPDVPVMLNMWKLFCLNFPIAMGCQSIFFRAEKIPSKKAAGIYIHLSSFAFPNIMNGFAIVM